MHPVVAAAQVRGREGGRGAGAGTAATPIVNAIVPRFAYVANISEQTVSIYTVNATTGQLRHNGDAATGTNPVSVKVDPFGKFAYVANISDNTVWASDCSES